MTVPRFDFRDLQYRGQLISPCICCLFWNPWFSVYFQTFLTLTSSTSCIEHFFLIYCNQQSSSWKKHAIVSYVLPLDMGNRALPWPSSSCTHLQKMRSPCGQKNVFICKPPLGIWNSQVSCLYSSKSTSRAWLVLFHGSLLPRVDCATVCIKDGREVTVCRVGAWTWG